MTEDALAGLESLAAAATPDFGELETDFGRLVTGQALAVERPRSPGELASVFAEARRMRKRLSIRGGGMSQSGQSVPDSSVVVDLSSWNRLEGIHSGRQSIRCQPGASWRQVLQATLPLGLAPKVYPLNLDLTVGGTLSAGGLGATSHRHGFAAEHVLGAEVVLASGEPVVTSPSDNRDVYDSVFGGVGRVGAICSVELALERVSQRVETLLLRYDAPSRLVADQLTLTSRSAASYVSGMCSAAIMGLVQGPGGRRGPLRRWSYILELTFPAGADTGTDLLDGLGFSEILHREADNLESYSSRFDVRFEMMRITGAWQQAHPWFEALVPASEAESTLAKVQALPPFFGDGHRISVVADGQRPAAVAYPRQSPAVVIAVLPMGVPAPLVPMALQQIAALDAHIYGVGGCRYLSGWLSRTGEFDWRKHYTKHFSRLAALRQRFDPDDVLCSKLPSFQ